MLMRQSARGGLGNFWKDSGIGTRPPLKIQSRMSDGISVVASDDSASAHWRLKNANLNEEKRTRETYVWIYNIIYARIFMLMNFVSCVNEPQPTFLYCPRYHTKRFVRDTQRQKSLLLVNSRAFRNCIPAIWYIPDLTARDPTSFFFGRISMPRFGTRLRDRIYINYR